MIKCKDMLLMLCNNNNRTWSIWYSVKKKENE